jgi:hypothetical protein
VKVAVHDHRGCSRRFAAALTSAGHEVVAHGGDVLLSDHDLPFAGYKNLCDAHERVFLYPHGGGILQSADGQWPIHPHTRGHFVYASGHVDVMRSYGYPLPIEPVGWALSDLAPYRPTDEPWRVLYAPMHPDNDNHLPGDWLALNGLVHDVLANLGLSLTVRVDRDPAVYGIAARPDVTYTSTSLGLAHDDIDSSDLVVSYPSTLAYLAVARGCPTVMYGQDLCPGDTNWLSPTRERHKAQTFDTWKHLCRYPYDIADGDAISVIRSAATTEATAWKARFVGEQMDPARFAELFLEAVETW